jgi:hypothetical protein
MTTAFKGAKHIITYERQQARGALVSSTQILGILPLNKSFSVNLVHIFKQMLLRSLSSLRDCVCVVTGYKADLMIQPQFFSKAPRVISYCLSSTS